MCFLFCTAWLRAVLPVLLRRNLIDVAAECIEYIADPCVDRSAMRGLASFLPFRRPQEEPSPQPSALGLSRQELQVAVRGSTKQYMLHSVH